jgi:hypothetical protein
MIVTTADPPTTPPTIAPTLVFDPLEFEVLPMLTVPFVEELGGEKILDTGEGEPDELPVVENVLEVSAGGVGVVVEVFGGGVAVKVPAGVVCAVVPVCVLPVVEKEEEVAVSPDPLTGPKQLVFATPCVRRY